MSVEQLQSFIGYLRSNKLMEQAEIIRVVKHMQQLDRRIGQLAMLRGFMSPEQVSKVMLSQTQINKRFVEMAVDLGYLNGARGDEIIKLQRDDLFSFCQAAVSAGAKTMPDMIGCLKPFLTGRQSPGETDEKKESKPGGGIAADIRANLQKIKGIAPLPGVVTQVIRMLDDPKVSMEKVGKVIMMDPGLVTTLLRIVNSAFYGLRSQAKTITQALVVLGTKKIKELVLVAGVMQKFKDVPAQQASRFWNHGIHAAQWSKELGTHLKFPDIDLLFINGFIHNVGELIIYQHFPAEHEKIRSLLAGSAPPAPQVPMSPTSAGSAPPAPQVPMSPTSAGMNQSAAERQVLGGTHADISAFLFEIWEFPAAVIQGAMIHHHPLALIRQMSSIKKEALIVHMSANIPLLDDQTDPFEYMANLGGIAEGYKNILNLGDLVIEDVADKVRIAAAELKKMFNFG